MNKPHAKVATLGNFIKAWDGSRYQDSTERVVVFWWGPILVVLPWFGSKK